MFASSCEGPNISLRETAEMWSFCYVRNQTDGGMI